MESRRYCVQFLRVIAVEVEALDDINAEKEAARAIGGLAGNEIAMRVQDAEGADGGALADKDNAANWRFAKENFYSLDPESIEVPD